MPIQIELGSSSSSPKAATPVGRVVGIDLGTTNSLVAIVDAQTVSGPRAAKALDTSAMPDTPSPHARILFSPDENPLLPSAVSVDDAGKILAVGAQALAARGTHSQNVLFSVKRLMGRSLKDLGDEVTRIPYQLVDDEHHAQARIKVGEKTFSPIEVSAEILKALKLRAEKSLNEKVTRAVVTVPAYFDDAQRSATKAAGRVAGLEIIRVLNEPTAAALAYGWSNEKPGLVAVYDFGGGTFDISILRIQENVFEVLATAGDTHLGGDDLDHTLAQWAATQMGVDEQAHLGALLVEAERVKRELSTQTQAEFKLAEQRLSISREKAEALWTPFVDRTLVAFTQALSDARLNIAEINDVLLVGGSTRVPLVRNRLKTFAGKAPNDSLNPDEAVALGAALQAEILGGRGEDRLLLDVVPLSLGIETMGGAVSKLIHRNSTIPTEAREIYTNHAEKQTAFDIHILQGERELVKDCRSLARFKLRGLYPAPPGFHRIEVLFRIDANGILNVRARDLRSGKAHEVEVRPSYGISDEELMGMLEAGFEHAESDMEARQLVDARIEADTVIRAAEKAVANAGHMVDAKNLLEIKARLIDLKNASKSASYRAIREAIENFDHVSHDLAELQINAALKSALSGQDVEKV